MKGMVVMQMNSNFVIIGQNPLTKDFFYHVRENNENKPGKIKLMGDGKGDVSKLIESYVKRGYSPEHIIYNGQPVADVFQKK